MVLHEEIEGKLQRFIEQSSFATSGVVITDLDGTAVHEFQGKIAIPKEVELGLMRHYERGRPLILNSLRFPLSVYFSVASGEAFVSFSDTFSDTF